MSSVINARKPKSSRTIRYANSLQARREVLDLQQDFAVYNGVFDAQEKTLTVYSIDGVEIVFERTIDEGDYFMRLAICNILVALQLFPSLQSAVEETFEEFHPSGEQITRSFNFVRAATGTKIVRIH